MSLVHLAHQPQHPAALPPLVGFPIFLYIFRRKLVFRFINNLAVILIKLACSAIPFKVLDDVIGHYACACEQCLEDTQLMD